MSTTTLTIAQMIDTLSEADQALVYDIVRRMATNSDSETHEALILDEYQDMTANPNNYKQYETAEEMMEEILRNA